MELNFRKLNASEIEVRVGMVNKGGVQLLLYKNARADQAVLDDTVGPLNWQRHHLRDNSNCVVSIWDDTKNQWVEKEDTGTPSNTEKEKGLASDSFKRACTNWGIGRELYTAPNLFIPAAELKGYVAEGSSYKCNDKFTVKDIIYDEPNNSIESVTIGMLQWGKEYGSKTFSNTTIGTTKPVNTAKASSSNVVKPEVTSSTPSTPTSSGVSISDDEILIIGSQKDKKYGDVKNSPAFMAFLKWVKKNENSYTAGSPEYEQFEKLRVANCNS